VEELIFLALVAAFSFNALASTQDEINHLLRFVAATDCHYERNGTMHTRLEAVKHIQRKYQYYVDDIASTEDFICYSATKSYMSGKYYLVHCGDHAAIKSEDWLLLELKTYRAANN
jgi:hypothetical protein